MSGVRIDPLRVGHEVADFSCGESSIDRWLQRHALANQDVGSSRTFVLTEDDDEDRVWGYYSLTVASIERDKAVASGLSGMPSGYEIPAVLLARMGRDSKRSSHGYGGLLLANAVERTLSIADNAGIRLMIVHALNDDAHTWYLSKGFDPSPIDDRLLMLNVANLKKAQRDALS